MDGHGCVWTTATPRGAAGGQDRTGRDRVNGRGRDCVLATVASDHRWQRTTQKRLALLLHTSTQARTVSTAAHTEHCRRPQTGGQRPGLGASVLIATPTQHRHSTTIHPWMMDPWMDSECVTAPRAQEVSHTSNAAHVRPQRDTGRPLSYLGPPFLWPS
jgi:hypothetical protein